MEKGRNVNMYDLLIKNAKIVDGSGGPWLRGDVAVKGGKIAKVGKIEDEKASMVINAEDKVLSSGFIDAHSHADFVCATVNDATSKITQGVTTEIVGNCGLSMAPVQLRTVEELKQYLLAFIPSEVKPSWEWESFDDWFNIIDRNGNSTDIASLVGHGAIRIYAMGFENRKPREDEMEQMKKALAHAMEDGALGLSTGLIYPPGCFADTDELIELCKVVAQYGGIYATHMRNEGPEMLSALEEALKIGRESGCPVHISHHKASGRPNFGKVAESLRMIEEARKNGIDVTCDVYPYTAGSTLISALLPKWVHEGGVVRMLERLRDSEVRQRIALELNSDIPGWENLVRGSGWENILICSCEDKPIYEGKTIAEIATESNLSPEEVLFDVISSSKGRSTIALFMIDEKDCETVLSHPLSMIGSDGWACSSSGVLAKGKPHPRAFGTFPRVLGKYSRERKVMPLETAVWKMTGFPAQRFRLEDRGIIKKGMKADIVVFDPETIIDKANYENPFQQPEGVEYVIMNGEVVVDHKSYSGKTLGKVVRPLSS